MNLTQAIVTEVEKLGVSILEIDIHPEVKKAMLASESLEFPDAEIHRECDLLFDLQTCCLTPLAISSLVDGLFNVIRDRALLLGAEHLHELSLEDWRTIDWASNTPKPMVWANPVIRFVTLLNIGDLSVTSTVEDLKAHLSHE